MPGFIIKGKARVVAGVTVVNFKDDPTVRLKIGQDGGKRSRSPRLVVLHTTQGIPGGKDNRPFILRPGLGPVGKAAENNAIYWARSPDSAGAHIVTDYDATHVQTADLDIEFAWDAGGAVNHIGWEIVQGDTEAGSPQHPKGYAYCYEEQLTKGVLSGADDISRAMGIQRQLHMPWRRGRPVPRLVAGGGDCIGFVGHNDITTNRGQGDPGGVDPRTGDMDHVRKVLRDVGGYEVFDFAANQDKDVWGSRQLKLNKALGLSLKDDGVPGAVTVAAIKQAHAAKVLPELAHAGAKHGLWIPRPGDELLEAA